MPVLDGKESFSVYHSKRLGGGSNSTVVLGLHKASNARVAIKVVDKGGLKRGRALAKENADPKREIEILLKLKNTRHPNLISVLGCWEESVVTYICMEECSSALLKYLKVNSADDRIVPRLLGEIVLGLKAIRDAGVVHRDIKPENILLTRENHVKIADFGSAILASQMADSGFAGSPEYAPPELLHNGITSGTPSDVWALGCVIYEVYVGKPPFSGTQSEIELYDNIKQASFMFPPYLPIDVKELVQSIIVTNPQDRPSLEVIQQNKYFKSVDWCNIHELCNVTHINADYTTQLDRFLYQAELVLHSGLVTKTRHLSTKTRVLVATSLPRLFYFDKETDTVKGTIPVEPDTYATALDGSHFDIHTTKRVYSFKDLNNEAHLWSGRVNDLVRS
eukprot:TRINITY_DN5882_c0_g1_i1.p1 TRINITY_DN5882_c0_g1~~TRINITY_DN5882_c0_g1_i1.p1  ORF type:complete len:393 (+),score=69.69 TRINITY_DN5882_c0_g1_i1:374-1552(+)